MEVYIEFLDSEFGHFPDGRYRLSASFKDKQTRTIYKWVPRWKDVEELFLRAVATEAMNERDSPYLIRFADSGEFAVAMKPKRPPAEKALYRVRTGELDITLYAKGPEEAVNEALKEANRSKKTLGLLTTVVEIVDGVEMHMRTRYYDTVKHLRELGFRVLEEKKTTK